MYIKSFIFGYAQYRLGDGANGKVLLEIDYANNKYKLRDVGDDTNKLFNAEARKVARDLLKRKHGVNFANKL